MQTRSYEAQDGSKRYVTEVIADEVEFLGSRGDAPAGPRSGASYGGGAPQQRQAAPQQNTNFGPEISDEEIPF